MVRFILVIAFAAISYDAFGLTLEECYTKARLHYPSTNQYNIIEDLEKLNHENLETGFYPQFSVSGRGTMQSEVTEIPIKVPGINPMSKDQYQIVAEVNQLLYDGEITKWQKEIAKTSAELDRRKHDVEIYGLVDRVNQLYFGILLIYEQLNLNDILQKELQTNFDRISACIANGVANQNDLNTIKVEQINANQKRIELIAAQKAYREMLSLLIGTTITENQTLEKPNYPISSYYDKTFRRAEFELFKAQDKVLSLQRLVIMASNKPKAGLFMQAGYGRPGLNMLKDEFSDFYYGGLRVTWNLGGYYTQANNLEKIRLNVVSNDWQKQIFLLNCNLKATQQENEIQKYIELMETDDDIIALRTSIKQAAEVKVANGTMSVTDLVREINAENLAIQTKALHDIQLLLAIANLYNTTNTNRIYE